MVNKNMQILLEIKESNAPFIIELLDNLKGVKAYPIQKKKFDFLIELSQSKKEMELIKSGKMKSKTAKELLNEL